MAHDDDPRLGNSRRVITSITHNLEWAIRATKRRLPVVNHNTRMLGRGGVMEVTLVTDPATLAETLPKFKTMLQGFEFKQGHKYAEFRAGDKTAAYGLTGLIVGGRRLQRS